MPRITTPPVTVPARRRPDTNSRWDSLPALLAMIAVVLVPIIVFSRVSDFWEFNKAFVFLFFVTLAWLGYFVTVIRRKSFAWAWTGHDWLLLALVAVVGVSTIWSVRQWQSIAGVGGWMSETLPVIVGIVGLTILLRQVIRTSGDRALIWNGFVAAVGLGLVLQLLQLLGAGSLWHGTLPADKLFNFFANSTGSAAVMAAVFSVVTLGMWIRAQGLWSRYLPLLGTILGWVVLVLLARSVGWVVFAIGMVWLIWRESQQQLKANSIVIFLAVGLTALGLISQLTNFATTIKMPNAAEVTLDGQTARSIVKTTMQHRLFFGTGPETWYQDFVLYRPASYNLTANWNTRFIKANAEWWQSVATVGVIGALAWLAVLLWPLWSAWRQRTLEGDLRWEAVFLVSVAVVTGFMATWSLPFLVWLFLAFGLTSAGKEKPVNRPINTGILVGFTAFVVLAVYFWYGAVNVGLADLRVQRVQDAVARTKPLDQIISWLQQAQSNDPHNQDASVLLANALATKAELQVQEKKTTDANTTFQQSLAVLQRAINRDPKNPAMIEAMNNLLNNLAGYISGAGDEAQKNFALLRQLEPNNPVHDVGYGQTIMLARAALISANKTLTADQQKQADSLATQAIGAYDTAIAKKGDYLQAYYAKAQADSAIGKNDEALTIFNSLIAAYPKISTIWTGRGQVLVAMKKTADANTSFEQAIKVDATDTNAYLVYAQAEIAAGNKTHAKEILNNGLKAVPKDQSLQTLLDSIK